ncbi:MAG: amino acid permease [Desulfovibrio sp.]|nr:amino acid permease [Desulfovibrio sp.]
MADEARRLTPYLGPAGAWALALGSSIGWGSLVITSSTYLAQAGPVGSLLGTLAGGLVMLIIARNYHYMMNCCPEAGGAYAYARSCFGHDHGFLVAWFLALTYLAIFWANATALPLFARYFLGGLFQVGKLYTIFGYDIFLGEVLLTAGAIGLFSLVCTGSKKATALLMLGFAICFTLAVTVCFLWAASSAPAFDPPFVPDAAVLSQVAKIAIISPWAFIGFENISHATEEFSFKPTRSFRVLVAAVITTTALYAFITLLSATAWPAQFGSWFDYIRHLDQLNGIEGLPAFYAARHYMGQAGVVLLMAALLSLVLSSLIGNILSLSRLFYALAKDGILPRRFASLNRHSVPAAAVLLVGCVSLATAFIGRTAIGWIVDVTTIGATLVYAFVSACAWKQADMQCDRLEKATGMAGVAIMVCFEAYLLAPNLFSASSMAAESYFLFVLWSVFGFIFFRTILKRDGSGRFGRSLVVWISLLSLVLYVSLVWMSQSILTAASDGINAVNSYYAQSGLTDEIGIAERQIEFFQQVNARSLAVVVLLFGLALAVLVNNYGIMRRKAEASETALGIVQQKYTTDPLTGVKSKSSFFDKEAEINTEISLGMCAPFALAVCDVNGLKYVNDTYGHKAGDEHIRSACHMVCQLFTHSPVYRTGGDEFVVFLRGADYENRELLIANLHSLCVAHIESGEVVVSGGLADFNEKTDAKLHDVFERADASMYREKKALKALGAQSR